ncbi:Calx-beta domain-containing protein [Novipirellula artificiosorum]|uniref:Calx-beta domain protein n=1 Tax=Novipirellula artificiosorum TaxID=2528016 RepID=A0A5C6DZD2_9BACT|nr:Calx-beta domain-containing protein [Novipirellula artificiosorum]TWU41147.1 Calx-beta domain protein [Novipirellula artificiosorum]
MSIRRNFRLSNTNNSNPSRMERLRQRASRWTARIEARRQSWMEKRAARLERYKNAFRGSWLTQIGLGLAMIVRAILSVPFVRNMAGAQPSMGVVSGSNGLFGRFGKSLRRKKNKKNKKSQPRFATSRGRTFMAESLEQRMLLAGDIALMDHRVELNSGGGGSDDEVANLSQSLTTLGHTVTGFTDLSAAGISAGVAGQDVLAIPEMEWGDALTEIDAPARTVISNFVNGGGHLMVHSDSFGNENSAELLNATFGWSLVESSAINFSTTKTAAAATTPFAAGPATLDGDNGTRGFETSSLPAGAVSVYDDGTDTSVFYAPVGSGSVTFVGYDWFDAAPNGANAAGTDLADWAFVIDTVANFNGPTVLPTAVSVVATDSDPNEPGITSGDNGQFTFSVDSPAPVGGIVINYALSGVAEEGAGKDFIAVPSSSTVTIPEGQTSVVVDIDVEDDSIYEADEDIVLTITSVVGTGASISPIAGSASMILTDDELPPEVKITASNNANTEDTDDGSFKIELVGASGGASANITVDYTIGGEAVPGVDHDLASGSVTFTPGQTSKTLTFSPVHDSIVEANETVTMKLTGVATTLPGVTYNSSTETTNIIDDDDNKVELDSTDGAEPNSDASLTLSLSDPGSPSSTDTAVVLSATPGAGEGADYGTDYFYVTNRPAALYNESENNNNNSQADNLNSAAWTVALNDDIANSTVMPHVTVKGTGNGSVDFFKFDVQAGEKIILDIDNTGGGMDSWLTLFKGTDELDDNDNSAGDSGSSSANDSMITYTALTSGTYFVRVAHGSQAGNIPGGDSYELHVSLDTPPVVTPVPADLIIPAGEISATVPLFVIDSNEVEALEDVEFAITAVNGDPQITEASPAQETTVEITDDDSALVNIVGGVNATEPATNTTFTVTLTNPSSTETKVPFVVDAGALFPSGDIAQYGIDYTLSGPGIAITQPGTFPADPVTGVVTFAPGQTTRTIDLNVINELVVEDDETVTIELLNGPSPTAEIVGDDDISLGTSTATNTILDEDEAYVRVDAVDSVAGEPSNDGFFRVQLALPGTTSAPPITAVTSSVDTIIEYDVLVSGTSATPDDDYVALSGVVTILAGETSAIIPVTVLDDLDLEGTETVSIQLVDSAPREIIGDSGVSLDIEPNGITDTVTISDNDELTVKIEDVVDGEEGVTNGQFLVSLVGDAGAIAQYTTDAVGPIVISYTVTGTASDGLDYTTLSGTVSIPAGSSTATIDILVEDDEYFDPNETVTITLDTITSQDPIGLGGSGVKLDAMNSDTLNIIDNETGEVSISSYTPAREPGQNGSLTFTLDGKSPNVTVITFGVNTFDTDDDPGDSDTGQDVATQGTDHALYNGTITFLPNETSVTIPVPVLNDTDTEGLEVIPVEITSFLSNLGGYSINGNSAPLGVDYSAPSSRAELPILADQTVDVVTVNNATEGVIDGKFRVAIETPSAADTVITYKIISAGGSKVNADEGSDFETLSGTVTILAGDLTADIVVDVTGAPFDDLQTEGDEYVKIELLSVSNTADPDITIGSTDKAEVKISDDDAGFVNIAAVNDGEEEGPVDGKFRVTLYDPSGTTPITSSTDTKIKYSVTDNTGPNSDFTPLSLTVTIPAGQTGADIDVSIIDDSLVELDSESITITLDSLLAPTDPQIKIGSIAGPTLTFGATQDTFLEAFGTAVINGGDLLIHVEGPGGPGIGEAQGLLRFDNIFGSGAGQIPLGAVISFAGLQVDVDSVGANVALHQMLVDWSQSTASWDSFGGGIQTDGVEAEALAEALLGGGSGFANVTSTVQDWSDGDSNYGWSLFSTLGGAANSVDFYSENSSSDPMLTVDLNVSATINIIDNDDATVEIDSVTAGKEPGGPLGNPTGAANAAKAVIKLSEAASTDTYVNYTVTNGTATAGTDYVATSGTAKIDAGTTSTTIRVQVLDDTISEGTEDVVVTLTGINYGLGTDGNITLGGNTVENVDINDNEVGKLTVSKTNAAENNPGSPTDGSFTITTDVVSDEATLIEYTITGTATNGGDYATLSGTVTLPAYQPSVVIPIDVKEDFVNEDNETVTITLDSATPGNITLNPNPASNTATAIIDDDDDLVISVVATDPTATEGADDGEFEIQLNYESDEDVKIEYTVSGPGAGLAVPGLGAVGDDYAPLLGTTAGSDYYSGTITVPAGTKVVTLPVDVIQDFINEASEDVIVTLDTFTMLDAGTSDPGNNTNVSFGSTTDTVTILDELFDVTIKKTDSPAAEPGLGAGGFNGQFTVYISNDLPVDVNVVVTLQGGSATLGDDYEFGGASSPTAVTQIVTIQAGETSATLDVEVIDDLLSEGTETIDVKVTAVSAVNSFYNPLLSIGLSGSDIAQESILDNDDINVTISAVNGTEPGGVLDDGKYVFTQNVKSAHDTVITYKLVPAGTDATAGTDYVAITTGTVTIPAGQTTTTLTLDVLNDTPAVVESDEYVEVKIDGVSSTGSNVVGGSGSAVATIFDDDNALVSLEATDDGLEPSNLGFFRVNQSVKSDTATVVTYDVILTPPNDAVPGAAAGPLTGPGVIDYVTLSGTVTISAGQTFKYIDVTTLDDLLIEDAEGVTVKLTGLTTGSTGTTSGVTIDTANDTDTAFILSNDLGKVSVAAGVDGKEGGPNGTFTISIDKQSDQPTVVAYKLNPANSDTALNPSDYTTPLTGTVTIPAFGTQTTLTINVKNDSVGEPTENVSVELTGIVPNAGDNNASQISIDGANKTASIDIEDNDSPKLTVSDPTVTEGVSPNSVDVTVKLDVATQAGFTVDYTTANDSAEAGSDYTTKSGTLTFAGNAGETKTVTIPIVNGNVVEATEKFLLKLSNYTPLAPVSPQTGPAGAVDISDKGNITIKDNDTMKFTIGDQTVNEDAGTMTFTITADKPSDIAVDLDVSYTTPGGAVANSPGLNTTDAEGNVYEDFDGPGEPSLPADTDYDSGTDEITFGVGSTGPHTVTVAIRDDMTVEGGLSNDAGFERFLASLNITTASATLGDRSFNDNDTAIGKINDVTGGDADEADVLLSVTDGLAKEPADNGQFKVTMSKPSSYDAKIPYSVQVASDSATPGVDYTTLSGVVTIPAGQTTAVIDVNVLDDAGNILLEDDEFVRITLVDPIPAGNADPNISIHDDSEMEEVRIEDTDTAVVNLAATTPNAAEPSTDGQFTVTLSEKSDTDTEVTYSIATGVGNATNGSDYVLLDGVVTILAGDTTATFDVDVKDDSIIEGPENVTVTLTGFTFGGPSNADIELGTSLTDTVVIADDDSNIIVSITNAGDGSEPETNGAFLIELKDASGNPVPAPSGGVTVNYTKGGTATAGSSGDYTGLSAGSVFFGDGETSALLEVDVEDDVIPEPTETVIVTLASGVVTAGYGGTPPVGTTGTFVVDSTPATVNITDNDPVKFTIVDVSTSEDNATATVGVKLDSSMAASVGSIDVTLNFVDIVPGATLGTDYTLPASTTVTFNPSDPVGTVKSITIDIVDDSDVEPSELFGIEITAVPAIVGVMIDDSDQGFGVIADNDAPPPPPTVTNVRVAAVTDGPVLAGWTPAFVEEVDSAPSGQGLGFSIPTGSVAQVSPMSWSTMNRVYVDFSEDVQGSGVGSLPDATDFALTPDNAVGPNPVTIVSVSYVPGTPRATLVLSGPMGRDHYTLVVKDTIVATATGLALDGEFVNESDTYATSGNGTPGVDFSMRFAVSPANASFQLNPEQFGAVGFDDLGIMSPALGSLLGGGSYDAAADFNGNGAVGFDDLGIMSPNLFSALPFAASLDQLMAADDDDTLAPELEETITLLV